MRIPGVKTAKTVSRWVQARILGGALILGYHRVADVTRDEYEVCVTPRHFAEQMEALSKYAHPIQISELVQCLKAGSVPPKSVAVTFDDGYADNLCEAKPILEKYAIPATVFVCTGYAGKEFWWDELERLVMSSGAELGAFRLDVGNSQFVWDQPEVSPEAGFESRRKFHWALYNFLSTLDIEEQSQVMDVIRSRSGVSSNGKTARAMTHDELVQLANGGLIEVGAHTRHHPMLPRLTVERQREEIVTNKHELEEIIGKRVDGFAYPNGKATDDAKRIVREAGFAFACTSEPDLIRNGHNTLQIPRFWPQNQDSENFMHWLQRWI